MDFVVNGPIPADFMTKAKRKISPYVFHEDTLELFVEDQLALPHISGNTIPVKDTKDAFAVIQKMQVRGAPLIAAVGTLGLLIELSKTSFTNTDQFLQFIKEKVAYLLLSRPTAINLRNAMDRVLEVAQCDGDVHVRKKSVSKTIRKLLADEAEENRRLVWNGYQEILSLKPPKTKFVLMTICNTGTFATSSWGTALGVIYALHQADLVEMVYALETRPQNQGTRITATELLAFGVPFTLITDSAAAWTMKTRKIDAVLVGADQVALNGDTANKIGTYMLAVLAQYHGVPIYAVVPFTSINLAADSGDGIRIEERSSNELLSVNGVMIGAKNTPAWNPAFDVTDGKLITKIITDRGNFAPDALRDSIMRKT